MTNILPFRSRTTRSPSHLGAEGEVGVAAVGAARFEPIRSSERSSQDEVRKTIILLDLALQHARELSSMVENDGERWIYDRHLASIELSLQIARERAFSF
ncbi:MULTISPECIES: hypothetical protein [Bradyrhizobium]|jgi:hypothetical protein|uniref:hypothetical protein n=1 Tax=Bradyrhizobium TaxID=374 RepID=UPI0003A9E2B1|nr:hypothetical protein [Bradyrhizobium denitrificans]MCL8485208.1 hypothetical protein [Bradyrhizobium denitrificans]